MSCCFSEFEAEKLINSNFNLLQTVTPKVTQQEEPFVRYWLFLLIRSIFLLFIDIFKIFAQHFETISRLNQELVPPTKRRKAHLRLLRLFQFQALFRTLKKTAYIKGE